MLNRLQRLSLLPLAGLVLGTHAAVLQCPENSRDCLGLPESSAVIASVAIDQTAERRLASGATPSSQAWSPRAEGTWNLQYFLYLSDDWPTEKRDALRLQKQGKAGAPARSWIELFDSTYFFKSQYNPDSNDGLSVVAIEFQPNGSVITRNSLGKRLLGQVEGRVVSIVDDGPKPLFHFKLAEWSTGPNHTKPPWSPALCEERDIPSSSSQTDPDYRYGPAFDFDEAAAVFGCREWAYQLYEPSRPYIDVTSYLPQQPDEDESTEYVGRTIGWSRFGDARKPVIGWHEYAWFCFYDCPAGEMPGRIDDIEAWADRFGWLAPQRASSSPVFPDMPTPVTP